MIEPLYATQKSLIEAKVRLGPLREVEIVAGNIYDAHYLIGLGMKSEIARIIENKSKRYSPEELRLQKDYAQKCKSKILEKMDDSKIGVATREYVECLQAWAEGAGIDEDTAWDLQNDNIGCQTAMMRLSNGSVAFVHTEEEHEGETVQRPTVLHLTVGGKKTSTFCYPHLLLGADFLWEDKYFQAVDYLQVRNNYEKEGAAFANAAAWISWRIHKDATPEEVVRHLGPFADGYAINRVKVNDGLVLCDSTQFAGGDVQVELLDLILYRNRLPSGALEKYLSGDPSKLILARSERAKKMIEYIKAHPEILDHPNLLSRILQVLRLRKGGDFAESNSSVRAFTLGIVSPERVAVYVGSGPATESSIEELVKFIY